MATVSFCRAPGPAVTLKDRDVLFLRWRRRAVIDIAVDCNTRSYPLDDQLDDLQDAITIMNSGLDTIADLDRS